MCYTKSIPWCEIWFINQHYEKGNSMKKTLFFMLIFVLSLQFGCTTATENFKVMHQVTGPIKTNCYLIYGVTSKEAAIIDPGWQVDTLVTFIQENGLDLRYIFITHGHIDHFYYVPEIKELFPQAQLCMHKDDYRDIFTAWDWVAENYGPEWIEEAISNPDTRAYVEFDMDLIGIPDIFVEDSQTFKLGHLEISAIHTPGHSPGGMCYYTGNVLFTGDVLFYRTVGRTDTQNGSLDDQITSVRKLYTLFPDSTIVYPGHMQFTDIGSEKKENRRMSLEQVNMPAAQ
jgi:hydroxyacylglutathione hydrolase